MVTSKHLVVGLLLEEVAGQASKRPVSSTERNTGGDNIKDRIRRKFSFMVIRMVVMESRQFGGKRFGG